MITLDITEAAVARWAQIPCAAGIANARAWAASKGYPLDSVPVTTATIASAERAHMNATWAVYGIARHEAIALGWGYYYARLVDGVPREDTRQAAIAEGQGYSYAFCVDKAPREDTRAAAIAEGRGYFYALDVDRAPHNDTRAAAIAAGLGYCYAYFVDKAPREDTRAAAVAEGLGFRYASLGITPDGDAELEGGA